MDFKVETTLLWLILVINALVTAQSTICPIPETILPCICTNRNEDIQIWCTHSDLPQVVKGVQKVGDYIRKPIDELIIENNYLPSLPGKIFQNVKILRLMLRHNGLERVSAAWLETQEANLVEIYIVENDLRNVPAESLMKLQNLQAVTIESQNLKRIPALLNMPKLRYVNIQSESLIAVNEHTFENLPILERLFIRGSPNLRILKENALYNLPKLRRLEITDCGINLIHMRALSLLPTLSELSLSNNKINDATMVGRATRDLPNLTLLNLNHNLIDKLNEGAFVDQPMLEKLYLSNNNINIIHHGAFHRVPKLRIVDLNYNQISQIHPESFLQQSGSGVEELTLIGNQIMHISEFRALLDALPRLRFLDMSDNLLQEIPRGALRGHPNLERLHLNKNNIKFIQADAFMTMPALRELHLRNNSLTDMIEGPFWNLPALKGLDLSYNLFQRLQPKLLFNLPSLRRINFSNNQLAIIDPITFMQTPLLEFINISSNALVSTHPATFRNLENLYELDVSSNRLVEFVPGLPRGLEKLYLQKNQITNLPMPPSPDLDLPSLRTLDISNNGIQKVPHNSMKTLHNLRRFYMKRNGLRQIDVTTFSDLGQLEVLDLSDNQIISIHPKSFSNMANLKQVNLHGNTIENFDFVAIKDNAVLSTLDFSKNKLKSISPNIVNKALDVEVLNISSNHLNELPVTLNMLPKLKILDASYNHIKRFDGNTINNIHSLTGIKMPNNKLTEIRTGTFRDLRDLETIDLDNNQIEIIHAKAIENLPNLVAIHLSRNHIVDLPDRVFSNLPKLRIIEMQGNRLQFISVRAFENIPLVQYMNLSNNQLTNIDSSGLRQLSSLEVLDLSLNRLTQITRATFQYMEWLVELNLDNNHICHVGGQPFDFMPRLKVLSLRNNKLTTVSEPTFAKLRNNIAILDMDGNPLVCNCRIIWLKSWLSESSSIGPKCADGTYVKGMPFSRDDCVNAPVSNEDLRSCVTHENEALLPNLATSQVFSSLDKIKDYATQIRNNYQINKITNRPSPEESEYFYDEYVDYPYNETLIDGLNNEVNQIQNTNRSQTLGQTPTIYAGMKNNMGNKNTVATTSKPPTGGFTFFGMPLPSIDMGKLLNTGRKADWTENKNQNGNKYHTPDTPKFETGGFEPVLPTTAGGFTPILNPAINMTHNILNSQGGSNYSMGGNVQQSIAVDSSKPPVKIVQSNTTHQKMKSEIHELQAYLDDDNSTHIAYNRTKNVEEQKSDPINLSKYNMMESNLTITQVTEKEGILITTDTSHDMSLQAWMETSTVSYGSSTPVTSKPPIKKHVDNIENQPTALSAVLVPNNEELIRRNYSKRPATITKVNMPHVEHYDLRDNYSPVINREAKTRFTEPLNPVNTRTKQSDGKDWYYKNYNNSNLEPYIAPGVHTTNRSFQINKSAVILYHMICYIICRFI
ncbi:protein artichoke [Pectinophora gossypiella]|uniref:protein artichoke n=1 Tax=Pectinophora gossypiella TaxID=13191 RepID=UPI00214F555B|nr:protein artichoke [Pectinophora gossypiella]XP_049879839.1 protein artichoke [Pectinophora gossypiella]XP_049886861.1 protein artichoke [Pectinophora gossypiella]XP_049887905.1 protein artichoke [Pectinophora gossypiella]